MTFAQSAESFEISGTVISSYTDEPISGAAIVYSRQEAVLTDSLGHFTIHRLSKGRYKLAFTALGFDNHDTTINIDNTNVDISKWVITTNCPDFNVDKALKDIKGHEAKLLLYGSIAPSIAQSDKEFKKKFGVTYVIFGDDEITREECKKVYNRVVFNYLDKKFGDKWRKEVRQDVVGLNEK